MNDPDQETIYIQMAQRLDGLEFSTLLQMVQLISDGELKILPHISTVSSEQEYIFSSMKLCCRARTLIIPRCCNVTNDIIITLPYLESLTINAINGLNEDIFDHLNLLKKLQIISNKIYTPDTLLTSRSVKYLRNIEHLHVYNNHITNEDIACMNKLKTLVLDGNLVSGQVINFLPKLEFCVINSVLYKYTDSVENEKILKKLKCVKKIKIF